jgi:hypothetical protein
LSLAIKRSQKLYVNFWFSFFRPLPATRASNAPCLKLTKPPSSHCSVQGDKMNTGDLLRGIGSWGARLPGGHYPTGLPLDFLVVVSTPGEPRPRSHPGLPCSNVVLVASARVSQQRFVNQFSSHAPAWNPVQAKDDCQRGGGSTASGSGQREHRGMTPRCHHWVIFILIILIIMADHTVPDEDDTGSAWSCGPLDPAVDLPERARGGEANPEQTG